MMKHHPDHNPSNYAEEERWSKDVNVAYDILSDPDERAAYDRSLHEAELGRGGAGYTATAERTTVNPAQSESGYGGDPQTARERSSSRTAFSGPPIGPMKLTTTWVMLWALATTGLIAYRNQANAPSPGVISSPSPDLQSSSAQNAPPRQVESSSPTETITSPEVSKPPQAQDFGDTSDGKLLKPLREDIGRRYSSAFHNCLSEVTTSAEAEACVQAEQKIQESLRDQRLSDEGDSDGGATRNIYRFVDREMDACARDDSPLSTRVCELRALTETNYAQDARVNEANTP